MNVIIIVIIISDKQTIYLVLFVVLVLKPLKQVDVFSKHLPPTVPGQHQQTTSHSITQIVS